MTDHVGQAVILIGPTMDESREIDVADSDFKGKVDREMTDRSFYLKTVIIRKERPHWCDIGYRGVLINVMGIEVVRIVT